MPNGQGVQSYINLNDQGSWFTQDYEVGNAVRVMGFGQQIFRSKGVWLSDDFVTRTIKLPMIYYEGSDRGGSGNPLGQMIAQLTQCGEQYLTFDNSTGVLCRLKGYGNRRLIRPFPPYLWQLELEFLARIPWFQDLTTSSMSPITVVVPPNSAPTATVASGGSLATGTYTLQYTYVTAGGETSASPVSGPITLTTGNQQISVAGVSLPPGATAVRWYLASGPSTGFTVQNNGAAPAIVTSAPASIFQAVSASSRSSGMPGARRMSYQRPGRSRSARPPVGGFTLNTAGNGVAAPSSGTTPFSLTYAGSVFAEPIWTISIPVNNAGTVTSVTLANTMSTEVLTTTFPGGLAPYTAWTITVDGSVFAAKDQTGKVYDVIGSFPMLYGPPGQVNPMTVQVNSSSSTLPTGITLAASWINRWEL